MAPYIQATIDGKNITLKIKGISKIFSPGYVDNYGNVMTRHYAWYAGTSGEPEAIQGSGGIIPNRDSNTDPLQPGESSTIETSPYVLEGAYNTIYKIYAIIKVPNGTNSYYDVQIYTTNSSGTPSSTESANQYIICQTDAAPVSNDFSITVSSKDSSSITIYLNNTQSYSGSVSVSCNGVTKTATFSNSYYSNNITFDNLQSNITYTITAKIGSDVVAQKNVTTASPAISPFSFPDGYETGSNPVLQTGSAVNRFSHTVWNDMIDKVKEIFDAKGWNWDTTYASFQNTKMTSSDRELTAVRFNSLRNNLNLHKVNGEDTGIGVVTAKVSPVKASDFITLKNYINSLISP